MNARVNAFSLRARLTLLLALAVLAVFGGAALMVDWRADAEMQQRFDASLLARAQSLAALAQSEDGKVSVEAEDAATTVFSGNADTSWYELSCAGRVIARTAEVPPSLASGLQPLFVDAGLDGGRTLRVVALRFKPAREPSDHATAVPFCELRYALDRKSLDDILDTLDFILVGSLLGACALVLMLTPWLVQRGLRPLSVLDHAMAGIGPDTPGGRLPHSDTTELVPLVSRFNEVLARMDAGLASERHFASGLAHEFRTRLAELRVLADVETRYPSGRDMPSVLSEVGNIGMELEATVTALLQLTRIQSGLEKSRSETILVSSLLTRVCARHRDTAHARRVAIETVTSNAATFAIAAEPVLLEIALDNLLGNAVAYTPMGSTVTLHVDRGGIGVDNEAPALRPDDLANFGQRFWRKGEPGPGHAGLGLALAGAAVIALRMSLTFALDNGKLRAALRWDDHPPHSPFKVDTEG